MDLVKHSVYNKDEHSGLKIFLKNKQYRHLVGMLEDADTKEFVSKYMHDISDAHVLLMLMKLYLEIENSHPNMSVFERVLILDQVLKNKDDRRHLINLFGKWKSSSLLPSGIQ